MIERPIIFSGEMVVAILDGRKTQTRRVIKPQPFLWDTAKHASGQPDGTVKKIWGWEAYGKFIDEAHYDWPAALLEYCPYGKAGDMLWVREAWTYFGDKDFQIPKAVMYKADYAGQSNPFSSPIFMPKWAARIWLEITGIRVERVQEITEEDAKAEGVCPENLIEDETDDLGYQRYYFSYKNLWDSLNAKRGFGWEKNPWVWIIEFKKIERVGG